MFRFQKLKVENYRCFEQLELPIEEDLTVLFAENGGGKTALLTALAMGMALFQPDSPKELELDARRDPRKIAVGDGRRREAAGVCRVAWTATAGSDHSVEWVVGSIPASGRQTKGSSAVLDAIETLRLP